jgi:hypothetical protein
MSPAMLKLRCVFVISVVHEEDDITQFKRGGSLSSCLLLSLPALSM